MNDPLVIWTGPVAKFQVAGATIPGTKELFIQCTGDGSPGCPALGVQLSAQKPLGDPLYLGAFSAGGSVLKRLMIQEPWRQATRALMLADATYTAAWFDKAKGLAPPIEGFVRYGIEAATGFDKMMVATASPSPNKSWPTGVQSLQALRKEIEIRTGRVFTEMPHFFGIEPAPEHAYRLGNTILAEYAMNPLGHGGHAKLAKPIWQRILIPWLQGRQQQQKQQQELPEPENSPWPLAIIGTLTAIVVGYLISKKTR